MVGRYRRKTGLFAACLFFIGGCDAGWEQKAEEDYRRGEEARLAGHWLEAQTRYLKALAVNPYHATANLRLAELYDTRLFTEKGASALAVIYYRRFLELPTNDSRLARQVENIAAVLERIAAGTLEDPADAVADFLAAARAGAERTFTERLDARLVHQLSLRDTSIGKHLQTWRNRLEGRTCHFTERWVDEGTGKSAAVTVEIRGDPAGVIVWIIHLRLAETNTWEIAGYDYPDTSPPISEQERKGS